MVETDLTGLAQSKTLPGVLTGLADSNLPDLESGVIRQLEADGQLLDSDLPEPVSPKIQQPAHADGLPDSTLPE